jgi:15-cis-phytoene synthase
VNPDPLRRIILAYAPPAKREGLAALLDLDDALALLLRTTSQPALGQLRLAWWRESLAKLDTAPPPAQPSLQALAEHVLPAGVSGESLVPIVHGWEVLVEEEDLNEAALVTFARGRGALFAAAARLFGGSADEVVTSAGEGWALADLASNLGKAEEAAQARALALPSLTRAAAASWPRHLRALGAMVQLARMEIDPKWVKSGPLARTARLLWHRLSGR